MKSGIFSGGHNILEYKDPEDSLNIDVFFKTEGYACLYKSYGKTVDAIAESDVTITLVRDAKPVGLLGYFAEHGYQVSSPYRGIYYITGNIPFIMYPIRWTRQAKGIA